MCHCDTMLNVYLTIFSRFNKETQHAEYITTDSATYWAICQKYLIKDNKI